MLVDLSVTVRQVTLSVAIMQLEISTVHIQVTVTAVKYVGGNFYCNLADESLCCIYTGGIFVVHYAHDYKM